MAAMVSLQGMMIADALAIVERRLDSDFATELAQLERALVRDGVNRDSIDAMLEHERNSYLARRSEQLDELCMLLACDELLMPSVAKH